MTFAELFALAIDRWPVEISIADAKPLLNGGQIFPSLAEIHAGMEDQIDFANNNWAVIGHWSLFQAFHEEAKRLYLHGEAVLNTRAVPFESINSKIIRNLEGEGWEVERDEYEQLPT